LGLFCFLGRGHLDPCLALGRRLQSRGHHVTVFHLTVAQAAIRSSGLAFQAVDEHDMLAGSSRAMNGKARWTSTVTAVIDHAKRVLSEAPEALRRLQIDAVLADQLDVAAGSAADRVGIPFISLSCAPPLYLDESTPAAYFGHAHAEGPEALARNRMGNSIVERLARPVLRVVNERRAAWRLPLLRGVNDLFSTRAIVTQLPLFLDLPRRTVSHLFYTGPFQDDNGQKSVGFNWDQLNGKPVIYTSMGTIRNKAPEVFRMIATACAGVDAQLLFSLGGGLSRAALGPLPGQPLVVDYVPQRALLRRAMLTINCAGLNTTLDSLTCGVPLVAIPVGEDQPGVAVRIARANVGRIVPIERASVTALRDAIHTVLEDPQYRTAARDCQSALSALNGADRAASLIEHLLGHTSSARHALVSEASTV
jgi:MGT family glycosyltransferase